MRHILYAILLTALFASAFSGCGGQARADYVPDYSGAVNALAQRQDYAVSPDGTVWARYVNSTGIERWRASSMPGTLWGGMGGFGQAVAKRNAVLTSPALPRSLKRDYAGKLWGETVNSSGNRVLTAYSSMPLTVGTLKDNLLLFKKDGSPTPSGTFTRASAAWYYDAAGSWTQSASGADRHGFVNISTVAGKWQKGGYLGEGSVTNYAVNSEAPASQTVYISLAGQYCLWVEGTGTCQIAAGASSPATGTGWGTATTVSPVVVNITVSGNVALTVSGSLTRFQLEDKYFKRSYVQTAGAAATKVADVLGIPLPVSQAAFDSSGTIAVDYIPETATVNPTSTNYRFLVYGPTTNQQVVALQITTGGGVNLRCYDGTTAQSISIGPLVMKKYRLAVAWGGGTVKVYDITDGLSASGSYDGSWDTPATLNLGGPLNGWLKSFRYFDRKLTDAEVNAL